MVFLSKRSYAVAKLESTPYTPETLTDNDFDIEVEELSFSPEVEEFQRKVADGTLDTYNSVMGKQKGSFSFMTPLIPGSAANVSPAWSKFAEACGYKKTAHGATGISWVPHADNTHIPLTFEGIDINHGASPSQLMTRMGGCMGNMVLMFGNVGEPVQLRFEFQGSLLSIAKRIYANMLDPTGVSTIQPPATLGLCMRLGTFDQVLNKFELNTGNDVQPYTDPAENTGLKGFCVAGRDTLLNIDPLSDLPENDPVYTSLINGTTAALTFIIGSTPTLTISAPVCQYSAAPRGEREGAVTIEKALRLHKSSGNDSCKILQGSEA